MHSLKMPLVHTEICLDRLRTPQISGFSLLMQNHMISGSSRQDVFCKKGVLRNFAKVTGKHLCQSLFFNKVSGLRPATLLKKRLWHSFPKNFVKFLRTTFLTEYLWWLLLDKLCRVSNLESRISRLQLATYWNRFMCYLEHEM